MRFATRAFAYCFIPFALLLGISFVALQFKIQRNVRDQLRSGLRQAQDSVAGMRARNESQVSRVLRLAGGNDALKEGLQSLNAEPSSAEFDLAEFGVPVILFKDGTVVRTGHVDTPAAQLAAAIAPCVVSQECDVKINGTNYLSIRMQDDSLADGYVLRSLQNVDAAAAPMQGALQGVFLTAFLWAALAAFIVSGEASRSMLRPLTDIIAHLRKSETAGLLEKLPADQTRIIEVRELIGSFNRAASAIQDARNGLQSACFEFVGSLAHALDARDRYTAGHSQRVSQIAMSVVNAMHVSAEEEEVVRIGALLHDIGKIGVPDYVLQKPGALTDAEFALIKQHPTIGCRILEGVQGFSPYLPVVELHHENWDGSGYPYGLSGKAVPLPARIVHVADAWDAMTSDRPYRRGFSHERALAIIRANAGTQFDPEIAAIFCRLMQATPDASESILRLSAAVGPQAAPAVVESTHWENA